MAKRRKRKVGLQKKVSSVFEGVSIPQREDDEKTLPKLAPDGLCDVPSKSMPKDSLVSKSSLMKKVCRSKSSSNKAIKKSAKKVPSKSKSLSSKATKKSATKVLSKSKSLLSKATKKPATKAPSKSKSLLSKATKKPATKAPSKRKTSVRPTLQDSPAQEFHRLEVKTDKTTPDRSIDFPSELTSLDHLIPRRSSTKKPSKARVSSDKATPDYTTGVPPKLTAPDVPIPPCVFVKEPSQTENVPDKVEPDRTVKAPSKETALDDVILQPPQVEEPLQTKDSPDELTPDRIVSIPSWMSPDFVDPQSSPISESTQFEDSSSKNESDLIGGISEETRDGSQDFSEEEPLQTSDASEKVAPSKKSWVPPKLTDPNHPISQDSLTKKPEQVENARDKAEPGRTDDKEPQKRSTAEYPASQSSLVEKLPQDEDASDTDAPDRMAKATPISKSADPQIAQTSASEKQYGPEVPPNKAAPSGQRETTVLAEASGPSLWQQINNKLFAPKPGMSPARQKVMVIFVPILVIILIFVFRQVLSKSPHKTKGASTEDVALVVSTDSGREIDWQIPEPLPEMMRDPIKLPAQSNTQSEEQNQTANTIKSELINIGTIVYSHDKPSAVVNGRIVHIGDNVSGITILRINRDSVEFEKDGERWVQKKHK